MRIIEDQAAALTIGELNRGDVFRNNGNTYVVVGHAPNQGTSRCFCFDSLESVAMNDADPCAHYPHAAINLGRPMLADQD